MSVGALVGVVVYCVQQLGMTLGVGAQTVLLTLSLTQKSERISRDSERLARPILRLALLLAILSGLLITAAHIIIGQTDILTQPSYIFKWALIVVALILATVGQFFPRALIVSIETATWYALFLINILAPANISWFVLLIPYGCGLLVCLLLFGAVRWLSSQKVRATKPIEKPKEKTPKAETPVTKTPPVPAPPPRPVPNLQPLAPPQPIMLAKPIEKPKEKTPPPVKAPAPIAVGSIPQPLAKTSPALASFGVPPPLVHPEGAMSQQTQPQEKSHIKIMPRSPGDISPEQMPTPGTILPW